MNTSPLAPKSVQIKLVYDGKPIELTITYDRRAEYRQGTLPRPMRIQDTLDNTKSFAAMCAWLWACLSNSDEKKYFAGPDEVAMGLTEELIQANFEQLYLSWKAVQPPKEIEDPLTSGSTTGLSPSSSST